METARMRAWHRRKAKLYKKIDLERARSERARASTDVKSSPCHPLQGKLRQLSLPEAEPRLLPWTLRLSQLREAAHLKDLSK